MVLALLHLALLGDPLHKAAEGEEAAEAVRQVLDLDARMAGEALQKSA